MVYNAMRSYSNPGIIPHGFTPRGLRGAIGKLWRAKFCLTPRTWGSLHNWDHPSQNMTAEKYFQWHKSNSGAGWNWEVGREHREWKGTGSSNYNMCKMPVVSGILRTNGKYGYLINGVNWVNVTTWPGGAAEGVMGIRSTYCNPGAVPPAGFEPSGFVSIIEWEFYCWGQIGSVYHILRS